MLALLLLACTQAEDSGTAEEKRTASDQAATVVGAVINQCEKKLELQIGFDVSVPRVDAELTTGSGEHEIHPVPFAGMDEDTGKIFIYEAKLELGAADPVMGESTRFVCADGAGAGFRAYDDDGAVMACSFGQFVAEFLDATGCPEA